MKRRTITAATEDEVREMLQDAVIKAGSQQAFAEKAGISQQYLSDLIKGRRTPGDAVLKALGLRKTIYYEWNID